MTEKQISENKERFLELISSIDREGMKKDALLGQLTKSDFFTAPASTQYHGNYKGGLCVHSLNVYDNLCKLIKVVYPDKELEKVNPETNEVEKEIVSTSPYSDDTLKVVALLHDLSKMNFYKIEFRNVKKYSDNGTKKDEMGKFDWVSEPAYKVRDYTERFVMGNHQEKALFMVQTFIPLSVEEASAILNHMGITPGFTPLDANELSAIYTKYTLACLLHMADMMSTFISDTLSDGIEAETELFND